jgi:hypothetical protein
MNEQAIQDAYKLFVEQGYGKSIDDFKKLISTNPDALNDSYNLFKSQGYAKSIDDYSSLMGVGAQSQGELVKKDYKGLMGISADIQVKKKEQPILSEPQLATQQPTTPQSPMALPSEDSFLASQKQLPTFETTPLKKEVSKPITKKEESLDFLDPILETITPELINKNEEFVVPKMNYQFGDIGFKFEESGVTGDYMIATAPNGKKITISLDPLFSSKAESQSEKLKSFIKENSKGMDKLSTMSKLYYDEGRKFETQKEVDNSIKQINNDATVLNQQIGNFLKQKKQLETQFSELSNTPENLRNTPEYIAKSQAVSKAQERLESDRNFILYSQKNIESRNKSLEKAVGRYTEMKSEQWAWYEVPLKSLAKGVGSLASGFYGASIDVINNYAPKGMLMSPEKWTSESLRIAKKLGLGEPSVGQSEDKWLNSLSQTEKDKIESQVRDSLKKRDKNMLVGGEAQDPAYIKSKYIELAEKEGIKGPKSDSKEDYNKWLNTISDSKKQEFDAVITEESIGGVTISNLIRNSVSNQLPINTTEEAYADIQKGFVGGALTGAIESIPSFLGGGKISRVIRLFAQAEDATMRDMENNPAFEGVSENEKRLVSAPISIATAILEEVGFRNVIASKGLLNGVVARALGKSGATTTARTFADFIRNDVDNMIARGALKLVGGALAEAETGALQQGVQLAVQKIYNEVKEKKMYKLPEDAGGVIADILRSGAQEAIGGFVLGMPSAVSAAYTKKGFLGMNDATFKAFEAAANDENIQKAFVTKLKNQVNQGEITIEQAKETLNNYRNSIGLFKSMPEGLDTQAKKEAMNLLKEKRDLENQTIGKDPALVKPLTDRINIINESLTKLSEDAIQEQAADESVLRTGEPQMGLQEVGEGNVQPEVVSAGTESQVLTNEEQERKVALENAFETPNTEDNTITIGEEVIPIENAQAELDALTNKEVVSMEKQFGKEFPTEPTTDQGVSVTNKSAVDDIKTKTTDKGRVKVIEAAQRVLKTLKSVLPNFDIVLHNDEGSFNAAMDSFGGAKGTRGNFVDNGDGTGRIDINLSKANSRTVAHEVAHAVMLKAFGDTPALFKGFRDRISKVLNESSNKKLMDFSKNYAGDVTYEEYLAELTGMLEQEETNLSVNTLQKIAAIINEIVSKITNGTFKPFEDIKDTKQIVDFFNSVSQSIRKGEEISPADIEAIQEGLSLPIGSPTTITRSQKGGSLTFTKEPLPLSFVTEADKIDINKLIDEIIEKKQNVWFWMADQLGRGNYYDAVIGNDHYLDAGPSFALDPKNRSKNILWASGLPDKTLQSQIDKADYIFFISGSPEKAKLFNRRVLDLIANRINKTSDFNSFKDAMNNFKTETNELKDIKDALVKINSFEELAKSPRRKSFLIAIDNVGKNKTTPKGSLKELLASFNVFIDYNELRDGFYKENDFTQNDIMLVGKPTGLGGSAPHSTYETAILGEVVGVPDTKINSWNIMPQALRDKYQSVIGGRETKTKAMQAKVIAAETGVVRGLEAQPTEVKEEVTPTKVSSKTRKSKSQIIGEDAILSATVNLNLNRAKFMADNKASAKDIRWETGWEKGADGKWRYEIPDGKFKNIDIDDLEKEMVANNKIERKAKISDVFTAPELYEAYPDAKDIQVVFKDLPPRNYGSFNIRDNRITVNENLYRNNRPEAEMTMLHEIQHYIQNKESFEGGSNEAYAPIMMKYVIKEFKNKLDIQKERYDNLKRLVPDNKQAIKDARETYKFIKENYDKVKDLGKFKLEKKDKKEVIDVIEETNKFREQNNIPKVTLKQFLSKKAASAFNLYQRVAGEVEARNVEARNKLTPEEKRKTLLSETEKFDREDQILIEKSDFYLTKEYKEMEKEFPISKSQVDAFSGGPYEFDKFSTSKIGTGEGNQAFGWGLYFSTLKSIAQYYANALSSPSRLVVDGITLKEFLKKKGEEKNYRNATEDGNPNLDLWMNALIDVVNNASTKLEALKNISDKIKYAEDNIEYANQKIKDKEFLADADVKYTESSLRGLNRMLQDFNFLYESINDAKEYKAKDSRFVYQVSLHEGKNPSEYTWLEWDKKIKKDVRDRILERFIQENGISKKDLNKLIEDGIQYADADGIGIELFDEMGLSINEGMAIQTLLDEEYVASGLTIYDALQRAFGNNKQKTSEFLLRANIDGVKYPAESVSRGATSEDARGFNYVVFDENAITIKAVFKSQQDATNVVNKIIKDARAQGFSEESIRLFLESKGLDANDVKAAMQAEPTASKKATVTETMLAGFNTLMTKVGALINKSASDKDVISLLKNDKAYINATDIQKEDMVRQVRAKLSLKQKSAPTADRLLGAIKNLAKITMTEKQALVKQIKDLSRGAKDAKKAITEAYKQLSKEIKTLATEGKLTVNQAANVLRAFSKVNVLSQTSVNRFTDYMTKVFANAEYASKLTTAKSLRRDISKLSKNKDKNANLRDLAQQFAKINPSMVEDIDAYNDMASKIKEATKGSTIRLEKVTFAETVNIENASKYIDETIKAQDEMIRQERIAEIQDLMGIDASDFSAEEMLALLESEKPITKYNEGIVREAINNMFNIYSTLINETINQGRDPFTDEEVNFTTAQKDVVKRFMAMDLSLLTPKEALQAVDALANFLQNSSTARMESVLSKYTGNLNAQKIVDKGIVASPLMKYWSESFGRFLAEQTTNLNILFEKMFKGFNRGGMVEDASGVTKLKNNKSMAERESNNIVDKYISQFYKRKANGEAYNTESNSVERGLTAFMMRNVIGTEAEMKAEFNRRKKLIEQSIKVLSEGSEKEKTKSELYQKIYDKILKDSKSIQEVKDKTDPTNLEGIEYWNREWADKYEQLSDVSLNVYNKVLDKDLNYTPDRFVKLESETGNVELDNEESAFHNNNGTIYKKETGVLMTAVKPETLPTNIDNGETNMYIDLSFDKNNANSMYDALVDINTAAPIRQIQAFLNSPNFKKIVPESKDAKLLKERIGLYVRNIRNKNPYSNDELSSAVRKLNKIASIGVGQALGGVLQPVKQMVPVAMNTIVNAGSLDVNAIFDSAKNSFINRSGYAISNRGIESQAQVESLNKLIDEASKTTGDKMFKAIEELNRKWLDIFLVKPDVAIARASWITYYEQSLKKQGIDTKGIDYNTHEVNEDAADYAQRMVDRQQNVSDADLAGKLFANKEATNQLFVKMLMPFASFRMNQAARVGADLGTLGNKESTVEDKKIAIKSLGGFAVEMVVFKMIAAGSGILLGTLAKMAMGKDEDDEEFKKRVNNIVKGQATGTFTDLFSPLPIADKIVQMGGNALIGVVQDAMKVPQEEQYNIFRVGKQDAIQGLGLFGIAADRATQLYEISKLASTGKYTDDFGKEKKISEKDQKALGYLIGPALLTNVGLAPVEVNSIIRNSIKDSKKATKTPEEKRQTLENAEDKLKRKDRKISALEYLKKRATSQQMYNTIEEKLKEINATGEEEDKIEERNKEEKKLKDELLFDPRKNIKYDNETDMKKYSPSIYNRNFGVSSEWYRSHKVEEAVDKKVNEVIRKIKDREYKYRKP